MGCAQSKGLQDFAPHGPGQSHDVELTAEDLTRALTLLAARIREKRPGADLTVMVVGGVVSTVLLHIRNSTQDVDFFATDQLSNADASMLLQAAKDVSRRMKRPKVDAEWFNNRTTIFVGPIRSQLAREGLAQNVTVFQAPGLRLLAAPWEYQFCAKVDRMAGGGGRGHDAVDAAGYLYRFFLRRGGAAMISVDTIRGWLDRYGLKRVKNQRGFRQAINSINDTYERTYVGVRPIID
jgi:hypothetical protein